MAEKVFVSCSSNWLQLAEFKELIATLGHEPIVVERKENLGKDPDDKSYHYMKQCDKIVFVITADAVDNNGKFHPTSNVAIEIGWAKDLFKDENKVYILVDEARQPSMINPTYIHFREGNYICAINQLIKELGYEKLIEFGDLKLPSLTKTEISCLEYFLKENDNEILEDGLFDKISSEISIDIPDYKLIINKLLKHKLIAEVPVIAPHLFIGQIKCYRLTSKALDYLYELRNSK